MVGFLSYNVGLSYNAGTDKPLASWNKRIKAASKMLKS
jgi:hypothetical protein